VGFRSGPLLLAPLDWSMPAPFEDHEGTGTFSPAASMVCPQRVGVKCTRYPPSCATFPASASLQAVRLQGLNIGISVSGLMAAARARQQDYQWQARDASAYGDPSRPTALANDAPESLTGFRSPPPPRKLDHGLVPPLQTREPTHGEFACH
jgi:hypothetical protein